jgi:hypothetical protein
LIITRAQAYSFDEFTTQAQNLGNLRLHREFKPDEIQNLPTDEISYREIIKSLTPYSYNTISGDRVMGFRLDRTLARKENIKRQMRITIKAKTGLFKKKFFDEPRSIENLMLTGIRFDSSLPLNLLDESEIEFEIKFKAIGRGKKFSGKQKIFYNPVTNRFFR